MPGSKAPASSWVPEAGAAFTLKSWQVNEKSLFTSRKKQKKTKSVLEAWDELPKSHPAEMTAATETVMVGETLQKICSFELQGRGAKW